MVQLRNSQYTYHMTTHVLTEQGLYSIFMLLFLLDIIFTLLHENIPTIA